MKYNQFILIKKYNEYRTFEAFKKCEEYINETITYIKENKIINKEEVSINKEFIHWFNALADIVFVKELAETYNGLSNNQKRKILSGAMIYTLKLSYKFNRGSSVYNKLAKTYTEKHYTLTDKLSINDLIKNIGMTLKGDIVL